MSTHVRITGRQFGRIKLPKAHLARDMRAEHLPAAVRQYIVNPDRRWRLDFAWPGIKVAVEVDGEVHRIAERFHSDIEKHAWLTLNGWTLLRVGGREVRSGQAITWLKTLLWERAPLPA